MNKEFSKDLYRYYGEKGENILQRMPRPPELKYISLFRKANSCKFAPLKFYYTVKLKFYSYKTHIQIPARTKIGEGFYIGHSGRVIINPEARLGKNINISTGVTIGYENQSYLKGDYHKKRTYNQKYGPTYLFWHFFSVTKLFYQ